MIRLVAALPDLAKFLVAPLGSDRVLRALTCFLFYNRVTALPLRMSALPTLSVLLVMPRRTRSL